MVCHRHTTHIWLWRIRWLSFSFSRAIRLSKECTRASSTITTHHIKTDFRGMVAGPPHLHSYHKVTAKGGPDPITADLHRAKDKGKDNGSINNASRF